MSKVADIIERFTGINPGNFLNQGHSRSIKTKKNILFSLGLKVVGIATSFLMFPLMIDYLGKTDNGIWLTLYSIISLYGFFEFGLGNGLRNKFAEAIANDDHELARSYVSTAYAIITVLIATFYFVFLFIYPHIDWAFILNASQSQAEELQLMIILVFSYFSLQFILRLISMILTADQRPAVSNSLNTIGSVLTLFAIWILNKTTEGSLLYMGIAVCAANSFVRIIATIWFFSKDYRKYLPSVKYVEWKRGKKLMNLGLQFFIMQFAGIVVYSTDNLIVAHLEAGPAEVTTYNTAFKYFAFVTMIFNIMTVPLWSAYTEAYVKQDFGWIKNVTKKFIRFWLLLFLGTALMVLLADHFYALWVGDEIKVPFLLTIFMALYVLFRTWSDIFYYFIYGASKIRVSLYVSIFASIVNIPLSIYFAKNWGLGIAGVTLATVASTLPDIFLAPIQYLMLVKQKAKGVWNK